MVRRDLRKGDGGARGGGGKEREREIEGGCKDEGLWLDWVKRE